MADIFIDNLPNCRAASADVPRTVSKKVREKWRLTTQKLCFAQAVIGPLWLLLATAYLHGDSRMHSQIVGVIMFAVGVAGYFGLAGQPRVHLLRFHFVMTFLGMMLIVQELSKIEMQLKFHCTAAFTMVKVSHLESHLNELKQDEMFSAVYTRMNEIDDMLELYAKGSVDTKQTGRSAGADRFYIQAKLGRLRRHAQQILQELSDKHAELEQAGDLDARQHKQHMDGITFAKRVIQRLSPQDGETEVALLTFQEYAAVLEGLKRQLALTLDGNSSSSVGQTLETESTQLHLIKPTWSRVEDEQKSLRQQGTAQVEKQQRREKWEAEFQHAFGVDRATGAVKRRSIQERMATVMEELPQMCMEETRTWFGFEILGWLLIVFQAGVAYCTLANLFQSAPKYE